METLSIVSKQNPKIKELIHLRKKKVREEKGLFIIEGYREILKAVESQKITQLFYCPELFLGTNEEALMDRIEAPHIHCSKEVFEKVSYRDRPDGLIAVAKRQEQTLETLPEGTTFVLIEGVEKPGNLGTILRTCDGFGIDGVIVTDPRCDIFNPNVVRASIGTLFTVPWARASNEEAQRWIEKRKLQMVLITPEAEQTLDQMDLKRPSVLVFGSEQYGLSSYWREQDLLKAKIEMHGSADSLNLAIACVIGIYESKR